MNELARRAASAGLALVRRGPREVSWTPQIKMGVGNFLYLWLWAHRKRALGTPASVRFHPAMAPWLETWPRVRELVVHDRDIRFTDLRTLDLAQGWDIHFSRDDLEDFIRTRLLTAPAFQSLPPASPTDLVVNVRRGDYYSNVTFRGQYGFDIPAYLRVALGVAATDGPCDGIQVVSDDPAWCRARLGWLATHTNRLSFAEPAQNPLGHLLTLASAHRLVLANSTFSYWGAYLSNVLHDNHGKVIAPRFHARHIRGGAAFQLDPRWSVVEDIPGGWDS